MLNSFLQEPFQSTLWQTLTVGYKSELHVSSYG